MFDLPRALVVIKTLIAENNFLTEKNFSQNIKFVIGVECPFFCKMLYLYFADGYDKVKINLTKFIEGLKPYVSDEDR